MDYVKGDDCCKENVEALNNLLCLDAKKYNLKKWWSQDVMEMLLPMHLMYTYEFSGGQQTAGWLAEKTTAHKTKFEANQKNQLNVLPQTYACKNVTTRVIHNRQ